MRKLVKLDNSLAEVQKKKLSRMVTKYLTYETGWMDVPFIKLEKMEKEVLNRNSKFSFGQDEFEVLVTGKVLDEWTCISGKGCRLEKKIWKSSS